MGPGNNSGKNWPRQGMEPEAPGIGEGSGGRQVAVKAGEDEHECTDDGQTGNGRDEFTFK